MGVAWVGRFVALEHALPRGRRLAQRLGERMLEIHEEDDGVGEAEVVRDPVVPPGDRGLGVD